MAIRGPIVAAWIVIVVPDATKQSSTPSEGALDGVAAEITEEEERVNDELLEHPTRDDLHEQRERGQKCEGVIHAHFHAARPLEPHGFDGTRPRQKIE
jgi:hypothetical protein